MIITSESFIPSDKIGKNLGFEIFVLYIFGWMCWTRSGGYKAYCFGNQGGLGMCENLQIHIVITKEQSWIVMY